MGSEMCIRDRFNTMLEEALRQRSQEAPAAWSQTARLWAEGAHIVTGDSAGEKRYRAFATREETVQMLYRLAQQGEPAAPVP